MRFTSQDRPVANYRPLHTLILMLSAGFMSITLTGCDFSARDYRLRITANVIVNGKLYTGSSVQTFHCREGGGFWGNMNAGECTAKGEAVVVKTANNKYLFVLLEGNGHDLTSQVKTFYSAISRGGDGILLPNEMPLLVTFDDVRNPASVRLVDPTNLAASFGNDATLSYVKVEKGWGFVTRGKVKKILPWLDGLGRKSLAGTTVILTNALPNGIFRTDFLRD